MSHDLHGDFFFLLGWVSISQLFWIIFSLFPFHLILNLIFTFATNKIDKLISWCQPYYYHHHDLNGFNELFLLEKGKKLAQNWKRKKNFSCLLFFSVTCFNKLSVSWGSVIEWELGDVSHRVFLSSCFHEQKNWIELTFNGEENFCIWMLSFFSYSIITFISLSCIMITMR